jgi:hypothetical protein
MQIGFDFPALNNDLDLEILSTSVNCDVSSSLQIETENIYRLHDK